MKDEFRRLPEALQRQILLRLAIGASFFILFLVIQIYSKDFYFSFPCLLLGGMLTINGCLLFYNSVKGNFISVQGVCIQTETTVIRKRMKNLYIDAGPYTLKIQVRYRIKNPNQGDTVIVYLSEKTPVYEQDDGYKICSYYALEIRKGV